MIVSFSQRYADVHSYCGRRTRATEREREEEIKKCESVITNAMQHMHIEFVFVFASL